MAMVWETLLDANRGIAVGDFAESPVPLPAGCAASQRTRRGGLADGVAILALSTGELELAILPQRGMGLWRAAAGDLFLGWQSPVSHGPVHPAFVPVEQPDGLGFLKGFDELLCRCGLESNGAPEFTADGRLKHPLHGRIANLPAHRLELGVDPDTGEVAVAGEVDEVRFHQSKLRLRAEYRVKAGGRQVTVTDTVTNLSAVPAGFELLYHVNFGAPLAQPGSRLAAAVKEIVPRTAHAAADIGHWSVLGPALAGFEEQVYFMALHAEAAGEQEVLLRDAAGGKGVRLAWPKADLPHFTLWKNTVAAEDGYVIGLEPGVNFPNPRSFEEKQGRVVTLPPRGQRTVRLTLEALTTAAGVARVEARLQGLQDAAPPVIRNAPAAGWTPT